MRKGLECERGRVTIEECRTCSLDPMHPCHLPYPMLAELRGDVGDDDAVDASSFTPSRLLGCFRQPILMEENDYWVKVAHQRAALRGTTLHAGLAVMPFPRTVREQRLKVMIDTKHGPQPFTAKPDVIHNVHEEGDSVVIDIWDWKTREFGNELTQADAKHRAQVGMYAWLATQTVEQWHSQKRNVVVRSVNICYIASSTMRTFTSLGEMTQVGKKGVELTLAQIPTVEPAKIEAFIRRQIEAKIDARTALPPILEGDAARWCFRCEVAGPCGFFSQERKAA